MHEIDWYSEDDDIKSALKKVGNGEELHIYAPEDSGAVIYCIGYDYYALFHEVYGSQQFAEVFHRREIDHMIKKIREI